MQFLEVQQITSHYNPLVQIQVLLETVEDYWSSESKIVKTKIVMAHFIGRQMVKPASVAGFAVPSKQVETANVMPYSAGVRRELQLPRELSP